MIKTIANWWRNFWKSLKNSRTVMLGVVGAQDGATRR